MWTTINKAPNLVWHKEKQPTEIPLLIKIRALIEGFLHNVRQSWDEERSTPEGRKKITAIIFAAGTATLAILWGGTTLYVKSLEPHKEIPEDSWEETKKIILNEPEVPNGKAVDKKIDDEKAANSFALPTSEMETPPTEEKITIQAIPKTTQTPKAPHASSEWQGEVFITSGSTESAGAQMTRILEAYKLREEAEERAKMKQK